MKAYGTTTEIPKGSYEAPQYRLTLSAEYFRGKAKGYREALEAVLALPKLKYGQVIRVSDVKKLQK